MKKQLVFTLTLCAVLFTVFSFKAVPQEPKATVSGSTIIEGGNEENLFMVGRQTDFKLWHQEGSAVVTIKFEYQGEHLETTLKPGNEIRLLADKGFVSASIPRGSETAAVHWTLYNR
ncbi:MAG: hypothetical protein R8G66_05140 [Cytophagales bacterium]|nr:hypothetical protein [Cytophagales bacterium]